MASPDLLLHPTHGRSAAVDHRENHEKTSDDGENGRLNNNERSAYGDEALSSRVYHKYTSRMGSLTKGGNPHLYGVWIENEQKEPLLDVKYPGCDKPLSTLGKYTEMQNSMQNLTGSSRSPVETENYNKLELPVRNVNRLQNSFSTAPLNLDPSMTDESSEVSLTEGDEEDDASEDYAVTTEESTKNIIAINFDNDKDNDNDNVNVNVSDASKSNNYARRKDIPKDDVDDNEDDSSGMESDTTPKPPKRNVRIDDILEATLEHDGFSTGTESDAPNSPKSGSIRYRDFSNGLYDRGLALGINGITTSYTDGWGDRTQGLQQQQQQQQQSVSNLKYEPERFDLNWEAGNPKTKLDDDTISPTTTLERTKETGLALTVPILGPPTLSSGPSIPTEMPGDNDLILSASKTTNTNEGPSHFISPYKYDLARHASLEYQSSKDIGNGQNFKLSSNPVSTATPAFKKLGRRLSMKSRNLFRSRKSKENTDLPSGSTPPDDSRKSSPSPDTHTGWGTRSPAINKLTAVRSSHSRNSQTGRSDTLIYKQHQKHSSAVNDMSGSSFSEGNGLWGGRDTIANSNSAGITQGSNDRSSPNPPITHRRTKSSLIASVFHGTPAVQSPTSVPLGTTTPTPIAEYERQNSNVTVSMFRTPPLENNMIFNRISSPNKSDNNAPFASSTSSHSHTVNRLRLHDIGALHSRPVEHNRSLSWNTHLDSPISEVPPDFPVPNFQNGNKAGSEPPDDTKQTSKEPIEKHTRKAEAKLRDIKSELHTLQDKRQQLYLDIEKLEEYKRSLFQEIQLLKSTRNNLAEDFAASHYDRYKRSSFDSFRADADSHTDNANVPGPSSLLPAHSPPSRSKFWKFFGKEQHSNPKSSHPSTTDHAIIASLSDIRTPITIQNAVTAVPATITTTTTANETPRSMVTSSSGGGGGSSSVNGTGSTGTNADTKYLTPTLHNKVSFSPTTNMASSKSHSTGSSPSSSSPSVAQVQPSTTTTTMSPNLGHIAESNEAHGTSHYKPVFQEYKISLIQQCQSENREVPSIVTKCIEYIEASPRGLKTEGIYRKAGSHTQIENLERMLYGAEDSDILDIKTGMGGESEHLQGPDLDINVVASVLKRYLRRFEEPVISYNVYDDLIFIVRQYGLLNRGSVVNIKSRENAELFEIVKEEIRRTLVLGMPREHMALLKVLIAHVNEVAKWKDWNLMNLHNLSLVFMPSLIRDRNGEKDIADMKERNYLVEFIFTYGVA